MELTSWILPGTVIKMALRFGNVSLDALNNSLFYLSLAIIPGYLFSCIMLERPEDGIWFCICRLYKIFVSKMRFYRQ